MEKINIQRLLDIARLAGDEILQIYHHADDFDVERKADNSPLTKADRASHQLIKSHLNKSFPGIPMLSEEGKEIGWQERRDWQQYWLVDPLDGTKEFIKKNGEFTVNIALIREQHPFLGVVYAPVLDTFYYSDPEIGAFKQTGSQSPLRLQVNVPQNGIIAAQSRSHPAEAEKAFYSRLDVRDVLRVGSSLKLCMVAEGRAHLYYRYNPTWEWDTAAGQAVVEAAGGYVYSNGGRMRYNKQNLLNKSFLVSAFETDKGPKPEKP